MKFRSKKYLFLLYMLVIQTNISLETKTPPMKNDLPSRKRKKIQFFLRLYEAAKTNPEAVKQLTEKRPPLDPNNLKPPPKIIKPNVGNKISFAKLITMKIKLSGENCISMLKGGKTLAKRVQLFIITKGKKF